MSDAAADEADAELPVRLFGVQAQLADAAEVSVRVRPGVTTVAELRAKLAAAAPALGPSLGSSRFAVDHGYVADGFVLSGGEEVALIGLVGGG